MVTYTDVVEKTVELLRRAENRLDDDIVDAIREAYEREDNEIARKNLSNILKNIEIAEKDGIPLCQDTGIPVFFVEIGRELCPEFNLKKAITEGVIRATEEIPLRPNAVHPLTRKNTGDNTGDYIPLIDIDIVDGDELKITVMPKGAGSENVSALKMLLPSQASKIPLIVTEIVKNAGGKPCPPVFVGVGIGATFDGAAELAKKALLRKVNDMNEFERDILDKINSLGIGPMGMGGKTTALAVLVETGHCHTASLPLAVNIQCWANRRASVTLR
ncbi:MAG TPA: fumarate hydratase [Archaeoglobaceae archaeon]|nr:fumarate hydratase [Archaeoglobaceae archaeon]